MSIERFDRQIRSEKSIPREHEDDSWQSVREEVKEKYFLSRKEIHGGEGKRYSGTYDECVFRDDSEYRDCTFSADVEYCDFFGCLFQNCTFNGNFIDNRFSWTRFDSCKLSGAFYHNEWKDTSLKGCDIRRAEFMEESEYGGKQEVETDKLKINNKETSDRVSFCEGLENCFHYDKSEGISFIPMILKTKNGDNIKVLTRFYGVKKDKGREESYRDDENKIGFCIFKTVEIKGGDGGREELKAGVVYAPSGMKIGSGELTKWGKFCHENIIQKSIENIENEIYVADVETIILEDLDFDIKMRAVRPISNFNGYINKKLDQFINS